VTPQQPDLFAHLFVLHFDDKHISTLVITFAPVLALDVNSLLDPWDGYGDLGVRS